MRRINYVLNLSLFAPFSALSLKVKTQAFSYISNLLYISILLLLLNACQSQPGTIRDNKTINDSLIEIAKDSLDQNPAYAINLFNKALTTTDSVEFYFINSLKIKGYFILNEYDSCFILSNHLLNYCHNQPENTSIDSLLIFANNYLGNYYMVMRNNDSAIAYFETAVYYCNILNENSYKTDIYINLADSYNQLGNYIEGINYYKKALSESDSLNLQTKYHFPIYFGLGQTYLNIGDFRQSDIYFLLAEKDLNERPLSERFSFCNNRGTYYYYKKEYPMALKWFQKAKEQLDPNKHVFFVNLCQLNMGDVYNKLNQIDSANRCLESPYQYFTKINHYTALFYLATIKAELALKQNNIQEAKQWLTQYNDTSNIETIMLTLRNNCLQQYYLAHNDYKNAYFKLAENKRTDDSIRSEKVKNQIAELDMRYKHDTTIMRQNQLISQQNNSLKQLQLSRYLWASAVFIILIIGVFILMYLRKRNDLIHLRHVDQMTKLRMGSIRNRISPHFLLNTLVSISGNTNVPEDIQQKINSVSKLLRRSLENIESIAIPLSSELEMVENYILLQRERLGGTLILTLPKPLSQSNILIPSMLIQIPVENAIKHGLMPLDEPNKELSIQINESSELLTIFIVDNGVGINSASSYTKGTGLGLNILYQTIHLLNTKNTNKIAFKITDRSSENERGTKVEIQIPTRFNYQF